jgi:hypothetical protein
MYIYFRVRKKVVDIDCSHLLLRDKLYDKRSNTMHKDLAKAHGANVLQTANKAIVDRYGEDFWGKWWQWGQAVL